jgi:tetratricopeptide (TPR) repeat protein
MDIFPYQKSFRKFSLLLGTFLLVSVAGQAQTTTLEGDVKGEDGKGLKDAIIKIERLDIKGNYKTKSDKKGHYIHAGLPIGNYNVTLEVDGKTIDSVKNVRTKLGDSIPINFNMAEMKQRQEMTSKAAESGQLTKEMERGLTAEQKAALEKQTKERSAQLQKNKGLNDAFNAGREAMNAAAALKPDQKAQMNVCEESGETMTIKPKEVTRDEAYAAAIGCLQHATKLDPNQHVVWANLADAYAGGAAAKTGQEQTDLYNKGIDAFKKAIELKPDDPAYLNNYGLMLARAKRGPEAQEQLTKAAQLDPPNAGKYYYNLGAILQNTSQYDAAVEAFKKACEADPNHAEAQYWYATALSSKITMGADGKIVAPPGMKEALEKYLTLKPDGQFAQPAKELMTTIGGQIQTTYENPNAPKKGTKKK